MYSASLSTFLGQHQMQRLTNFSTVVRATECFLLGKKEIKEKKRGKKRKCFLSFVQKSDSIKSQFECK